MNILPGRSAARASEFGQYHMVQVCAPWVVEPREATWDAARPGTINGTKPGTDQQIAKAEFDSVVLTARKKLD